MPFFKAPPLACEDFYRAIGGELEALLQAAGIDSQARRQTALLVGSSSFDVHVSEQQYQRALRERPAQAVPMPIIGYGKTAEHWGEQLGLSPHRYAYSTACTSSANALLYGKRLIEQGLVEHALVLGLEPSNTTSALGFYGLGLISDSGTMHPFDDNRDGLILGEGCAAALLSAASQTPPSERRWQLAGGAIGTDNHSLTAAHSDGKAIAQVIAQALADAGIGAEEITAIKAHGTASLKNDEAEAAALNAIFKRQIPTMFALKPFIGHTLGACGTLELALCIGALEQGSLPYNPQANNNGNMGIRLLTQPKSARPGYYLFNCFAFGGNNNALVIRDCGPEAHA
jgi:3-oxoacyl-[acyl-carrier-protein] synthase-1